MNRSTRKEYYFSIVRAVMDRSTCNRGKKGAILVRDGRVLATGFSGSPSKAPHCDDVGHEIEQRATISDQIVYKETAHCVRTVHAEANAVAQSARHGPPIDGAEVYCTAFPCYDCAKLLVNVGIVAVHAEIDYQKSKRSKELFTSLGIPWTIEDESKEGDDR